MYQHTPWGILLLLLLNPNLVAAAYQREIDDFAVAYRVQLYETYRHDRHEYHSRMAIGKQAVQAYRSQSTQEGRQAIIDWFSAAIEASKPGLNGTLPELPPIDPVPSPEQIAATGDEQSDASRDTAGTENGAPDLDIPPADASTTVPFESASPADPDTIPAIGKNRSLLGRFAQLFVRKPPGTPGSHSQPPLPPAAADRSPHDADSAPDVWESLERLAERDPREFDISQVVAEVDDSTASEFFADEAQGSYPDMGAERSFPGVTETNARTAGYNLALDGLKSRADRALAGNGIQLPAIVDRLESLVAARRRIQELIKLAPASQRGQLIQLDPIDEFVRETRDLLHQFTTVGEGLSADRLKSLCHRLDTLAE